MSNQFTETNEQPSQRKFGSANTYSARIQEAMRYNKLSAAEYSIAMTLLRVVSQGYTEERWKEEQQRTLKALSNQPSDKAATHADAINRYEQVVSCLKDFALWPW